MESTTRGNQDDKSVTTSKNETNTTNRRENGKSPRSSHKESATGEGSAAVEASDPHGEGTKLGHYIVGKYSSFITIRLLCFCTGKSLGKGTFGKVKMAQHILTKEKVAIKILEKARIKDKKDIERISREIKILKKVRHPNVI